LYFLTSVNANNHETDLRNQNTLDLIEFNNFYPSHIFVMEIYIYLQYVCVCHCKLELADKTLQMSGNQ